MLPVGIENVDIGALRSLIADGALESKTIEYKRKVPGRSESDVVPFLAAVSSFAKTAGGDLLLGIEAEDGVPVDLPGVEIDNLDGEKLRLEAMLRNGLEPRLPRVHIRPIEVEAKRYVLLIRVPGSWVAPHRVRKNNQFYARTSSEKFPLDVGELRTAFTMSETLAARIRNFRTERIARIQGRETPVPLNPGGCLVVHAVPLEGFAGSVSLDVGVLGSDAGLIRPMQATTDFSRRINLDGHMTFCSTGGGSTDSYVQKFRTCAVESVLVLADGEGRMYLPSAGSESDVMGFLGEFAGFARELSLEPPYFLFLSFVGVRGCVFGVDRSMRRPGSSLVFQDDMVVLPEIAMLDRDAPVHEVLRPVFDMVWNAFGFIGSRNYDDEGNWVGH